MKARLERGEGTILLQNRRGFAPFVECLDCGWVAMCDRCNVTFTYHAPKQHLRCHYCGKVRTPPNMCPTCSGIHVDLRGIGTQRVEEEIGVLLPAATTLRMDMDTTTRRGSHERLLRQFGEGKADILLGTQMVAKGLDFPRVTLVGVVSADTQMLLPDFRASERTFQLLTQVAGRAGRSSIPGEVLIQTHQPAHRTLAHVLTHDYRGFYEEEIEQRRELEYPPFSRLVLLEFKGKDEGRVQRMADRVRALLPDRHETMTVLGPAPAVIARIRNRYRWHMLIKNSRRGDPSGAQMRAAVRRALVAAAGRGSRSVSVSVDVDPVGLL
jgi:primosomal protein N' (replication factor Y)